MTGLYTHHTNTNNNNDDGLAIVSRDSGSALSHGRFAPVPQRGHYPSLSLARSPSLRASASVGPLPDIDDCLYVSAEPHIATSKRVSHHFGESVEQPSTFVQFVEQDTHAQGIHVFQAPDAKEKLAIALSLAAIIFISIAACLTTLLDWVL